MQSHPCILRTCFPCKYVRGRGLDMLRCAVCGQCRNRNHSCLVRAHHITHNRRCNARKCLDPCPQKTHQDTSLYTDPHAGRSLPYTLKSNEQKKMKCHIFNNMLRLTKLEFLNYFSICNSTYFAYLFMQCHLYIYLDIPTVSFSLISKD